MLIKIVKLYSINIVKGAEDIKEEKVPWSNQEFISRPKTVERNSSLARINVNADPT